MDPAGLEFAKILLCLQSAGVRGEPLWPVLAFAREPAVCILRCSAPKKEGVHPAHFPHGIALFEDFHLLALFCLFSPGLVNMSVWRINEERSFPFGG